MLIADSEDFLKAEAERRRRKDAQRGADDRLLDAWERYRVVSDHCDRVMDIGEQYDRKTRFALMILGTLNALNLVLVSRSDVTATMPGGPLVIGAYVACYGLLSVVLLGYAITALRPPAEDAQPPLQTLDAWCDGWRQMQVGAVNRQIAASSYAVACTNARKAHALGRVYAGLRILALLTMLMIVAVATVGSPHFSRGF
jgi:hypothetical protein